MSELDSILEATRNGTLTAEAIRAAVMSLKSAQRQGEVALNLVPSENRISPLARLPLGSDFYNRYFFNDSLDPAFWQFRGGQAVSRFETDIALPVLSRLADAGHVNVRPISGLSAMLVALAGLGGEPGGIVVSIDHRCGGHYATTSVVARLGLVPRTVAVSRGALDLAGLRAELRAGPVRLVYADLQNSLHPLDVESAAQVIAQESPGTLLHVDSSHTLGLVLGKAMANPLDLGADSFGGSTHKSFPGPQKGVLFTRSPQIGEKFRAAQFFLLSSHHFAETISLALAGAEFEHFGRDYARQVVANASRLAKALRERGFEVVGDGDQVTSTHQVWLRAGGPVETDDLAHVLYQGGIRVNVQTDLPGLPGDALRLGVNEMTFEGAGGDAMTLMADAFGHARDGTVPMVSRIRQEIRRSFAEPFYYTDF